MSLGIETGFRSDPELIASAEAVLRGELRLRHYAASKIHLPFDSKDLVTVSAPVHFASLVVPDILIDAYQLSGREEFLAMARDVIVRFAEYEKGAWLPAGFLWNDHAIADRIHVLVKFWSIYRGRTDFDERVATVVLALLARSGQLLAKPSHFTFRTNHGVMQNVGLLQLCVAFPNLDGMEDWCDSAVGRLDTQLKYYIDGEGVVLEHSAGYHEFGMELLGMSLRCMTLLKRPVPSEWLDKYRKAQEHYAMLRRPDGTLPMYGDTHGLASVPRVSSANTDGWMGPLHPVSDWRPGESFALYPVAGVATWWTGLAAWPDAGRLSQTTVTWGSFESRAHKHADEMSVILWAGGQDWVTNIGYWPYDVAGRADADGWPGANAPHLFGERPDSARTAEVLGYGHDREVTILDLRRRGPDGYVARRQIIQVGEGLWLVLDEIRDDAARRSVTTWTTAPSVAIAKTSVGNAYELTSQNAGNSMTAFFATSGGAGIETVTGSFQPFAGWVVTEVKPEPAWAFVVEQPSTNSWAIALWIAQHSSRDSAIASAPAMQTWTDGDHWTFSIPLHRGEVVIRRAGKELQVRDDAAAHPETRVALSVAPDVTVVRAAIRSAFEKTGMQFPMYKELVPYRLRVTYWLIGLLLVQEIIFFLLRHRVAPYRRTVRPALAAAWLCLGAWIAFVYLE